MATPGDTVGQGRPQGSGAVVALRRVLLKDLFCRNACNANLELIETQEGQSFANRTCGVGRSRAKESVAAYRGVLKPLDPDWEVEPKA
jgi:hypothetical protein